MDCEEGDGGEVDREDISFMGLLCDGGGEVTVFNG
jgi:hypothetical protein